MLIRLLAVIPVISMVIIAVLGPWRDADALIYIASKPKGLRCEMAVTGIGNPLIDPKSLICEASPPPEGGVISGVVACGNGGKKINPAPGIQLADFTGEFGTIVPLNPKNCDTKGKCKQTVDALLDPNELATLNFLCPNEQNWVALDFAPCAMTVTGQVLKLCGTAPNQTTEVDQEVTYSCVMKDETGAPNCNLIVWDRGSQALTGPYYTCIELSRKNLNPC